MPSFKWNRSDTTVAAPVTGNWFGKYVPARYVFAISGLIIMVVVYGIKLDLSIPMGATDLVSTAKSKKRGLYDLIRDSIPVLNNDTCRSYSSGASEAENGTFGWSEPLRGPLLTSYLCGYIISQLPAAYIAQRLSAKYVLLFSLVLHLSAMILMSVADKLHCSLMTLVRICEGIGGGVTFPAIHTMLAAWSPIHERSTMSSVIYSGTSLGIAFSILSNGYTLILGTVTCVCICLCIYLIQDTPNKQPIISLTERNYINSSSGVSGQLPIPWRNIFTSLPFLAILVAHICFYWGWYTMLLGMSSYIEQELNFNIKENAIASLPFFTMWLFSLALGKILDRLSVRGTVSITLARKMATLIASVIPMICLLLLCFVTYKPGIAASLLAIGITCMGGMFSGFLLNHVDIAPNHAGTLMAITNTAATIPAMILPIFIDSMTHGNPTSSEWRTVFFVAIAFYIIGIIVYVLYASSEEQAWNKSQAVELNTVSTSRTINETSPFTAGETKAPYEIDN